MADITYDENTMIWAATRCAKERPGLSYARVPAEVVASDAAANTVTLRVPKTDGQPATLTFAWSNEDKNYWIECPTTLLSTSNFPKVPGPPRKGELGYIYIEKSHLKENNLIGTPKWPDKLSEGNDSSIADTHSITSDSRATAAGYWPMRVWPTSITLEGIGLSNDDGSSGSVNLNDPLFAAPDQTLKLTGGTLEVLLSQRGFSRFNADPPWNVDTLKAAIKTIRESKEPRAIAAAWDHVAIWNDAAQRREQHPLEAAAGLLAGLLKK
jgi:hypothetical protein